MIKPRLNSDYDYDLIPKCNLNVCTVYTRCVHHLMLSHGIDEVRETKRINSISQMFLQSFVCDKYSPTSTSTGQKKMAKQKARK